MHPVAGEGCRQPFQGVAGGGESSARAETGLPCALGDLTSQDTRISQRRPRSTRPPGLPPPTSTPTPNTQCHKQSEHSAAQPGNTQAVGRRCNHTAGSAGHSRARVRTSAKPHQSDAVPNLEHLPTRLTHRFPLERLTHRHQRHLARVAGNLLLQPGATPETPMEPNVATMQPRKDKAVGLPRLPIARGG